ncbi:MAG: sigma factor [Actinomycetota bacterium]|nr:sigma factor [Actinomycetota bacterium]
MKGLQQLLQSTGCPDADTQMSNEEIVAKIQSLVSACDPADRKKLAHLQEELYRKTAALVTTLARQYNRGHPLTEDEQSELPLAVFDAARKYDPARGAQFSTYLAFYVRSALQREHAFTHGQSQAKYARAARMLNNPQNYDREQVRRAEAFLRSKKAFSEETVLSDSDTQMSAEDLLFMITEQNLDDAKNDRLLALAREAILNLGGEEQRVLLSMLDPQKATTEYGLKTIGAVAKDIDLDELSVEVDRQRVFVTIRDYIFERDPSLAPPGWTSEQKGIQVPGTEVFVLGLFGMPTSGEMGNYAKRIGGIHVRQHCATPTPRQHRVAGDPSETAGEDDRLSLFPDDTQEELCTPSSAAETAETKSVGYGLGMGRMR